MVCNGGLDLKNLFKNFSDEQLFWNEPMSKHTSFKVGGCVDLLFMPRTKEEVLSALEILKSNGLNYFVMGNGSNLIVRDKGFEGVIIKISEQMSKIEIRENRIFAESGALLSQIAGAALENSLTGFEFASGIPGSFGGAIFMNAGAYDGEIKDVLIRADVIDSQGEFKTFTHAEMQFGYRTSLAQKENFIVLGGELDLRIGEQSEIKAKSDDFNFKRRDKQPLEFPSAGSTFKRPSGYFAGKLIMDSGLRGYSIGGAQISEKHCGFVINKGNATAQDILELIEHVKNTVLQQFQVELEPEVRVIGN